MEAIHRLLDRIGHATGYHLLPDWRLRHWEFARHLDGLFAGCRINLVLDVGANTGQYRNFLRRHVGYRGPIASFEPVAANVDVLRSRAAQDDQWRVWSCALGPVSESRAFNVMRRSTLSSFLAPDNRESSSKLKEHNSVHHVEDVAMRTLADVWPELVHIYGPDVRPYLKMDTQGFDMQVIHGAHDVLARIVAAQSELLLRPLYEGAPHYTEALRDFEALGFNVAGLFPVSRDQQGRVRACDCTLVNMGAERTGKRP